MYVSIDLDGMRFLHKHENHRAVADLVYIEAPDAASLVTPYDHSSFLRDFTDMELKMLYRNTTGVTSTEFGGDALRAIIRDLADRLPVSDIVESEVEHQASLLREDNLDRYKYVKGSNRPAKQTDLFELTALTAARNNNEEMVAARPAAPRTNGVNTVALVSNTARPARPAAAPRAATGAPRASGVREKIWAVADRMWEEAGKPTEKSRVLALRKEMMTALEAEGVKRTSSSNELGNWQKARIA